MATILSGGQTVINSFVTAASGFPAGKAIEKFWKVDHTSTSVAALLGSAPTPTGTRTNVNDATGSYVNHATTTAVGNAAGWTDAERNVTQRQLLSDLTYVVKTGAAAADIQDCRINIGVSSQTAAGTDTPGGHFALFRFYTTLSDTTWQCMTRDNVTTSTTDSLVTVAADTRYVLRIDMSTSGFVKFYINDVLVANTTANLPSATATLLAICLIENRNIASARALRIAGLSWESR